MKPIKLLGPVIASTLLLLGACSTITLVEARKKTDIGGAFSVESPVAWNRVSNRDLEMWTVDAFNLQRIVFTKGVSVGDPVFPVKGSARKPVDQAKLPKFNKDMTPIELVEAFETSMIQNGAKKMEVTRIQPTKVGGGDGFNFVFEFITEDGLEMQGKGLGTVRNERLYLAAYLGARMYFYGKHEKDVDAIFQSIEFGPEGKGFSIF